MSNGTMWKEITAPGSLKQISYDGKKLVGVTDKNEVFVADSNLTTDPNWKKIAGAMKHVVVLGDELYATDNNQDYYYGCSVGDPDWVSLPGKITQLHYDGAQLVGVNAQDQIFIASSNLATKPDWVVVNGLLIHIVVRDGILFAVNRANNIFTGNSRSGANAGWAVLPGLLKQICYDGVKLAGVNGLNQVFIADDNIRTAPIWRVIDGVMKYVELLRDDMFGVDAAGKLFYKSFAPKSHKCTDQSHSSESGEGAVEYKVAADVEKYVIYVDGKDKYVSKEEFEKANS